VKSCGDRQGRGSHCFFSTPEMRVIAVPRELKPTSPAFAAVHWPEHSPDRVRQSRNKESDFGNVERPSTAATSSGFHPPVNIRSHPVRFGVVLRAFLTRFAGPDIGPHENRRCGTERREVARLQSGDPSEKLRFWTPKAFLPNLTPDFCSRAISGPLSAHDGEQNVTFY
jgi:hypothetical protein